MLFSALNRRHHCRLCGALICGEPSCSKRLTGHQIRACPRCCDVFRAEVHPDACDDPLAEHFAALVSSRTQVLQGLPKFNEYLCVLEEELSLPVRNTERIDALHLDAAAVRSTLHLIFDHYMASLAAMARLQQQPLGGSQRSLVLGNVLRAAEHFLKMHKFSLKMLPDRFPPPPPVAVDAAAGRPRSRQASSFVSQWLPGFCQTGSGRDQLPAQQPAPLPANFGALMQRLEVLHEQRSQVELALEEARLERRYGDMPTLQAALQEVKAEIDAVKLMCSQG